MKIFVYEEVKISNKATFFIKKLNNRTEKFQQNKKKISLLTLYEFVTRRTGKTQTSFLEHLPKEPGKAFGGLSFQ